MLRRISIALSRSYLKSAQNMFYAIYSGIPNWDINPEENPYMGTKLRPKGAQYMKGQGIRKLKYMKK